jgi:hypothetical protein
MSINIIQLLLLEASVRSWCSTLLLEAAAFRSCSSKLLLLEEAAVNGNYNSSYC